MSGAGGLWEYAPAQETPTGFAVHAGTPFAAYANEEDNHSGAQNAYSDYQRNPFKQELKTKIEHPQQAIPSSPGFSVDHPRYSPRLNVRLPQFSAWDRAVATIVTTPQETSTTSYSRSQLGTCVCQPTPSHYTAKENNAINPKATDGRDEKSFSLFDGNREIARVDTTSHPGAAITDNHYEPPWRSSSYVRETSATDRLTRTSRKRNRASTLRAYPGSDWGTEATTTFEWDRQHHTPTTSCGNASVSAAEGKHDEEAHTEIVEVIDKNKLDTTPDVDEQTSDVETEINTRDEFLAAHRLSCCVRTMNENKSLQLYEQYNDCGECMYCLHSLFCNDCKWEDFRRPTWRCAWNICQPFEADPKAPHVPAFLPYRISELEIQLDIVKGKLDSAKWSREKVDQSFQEYKVSQEIEKKKLRQINEDLKRTLGRKITLFKRDMMCLVSELQSECIPTQDSACTKDRPTFDDEVVEVLSKAILETCVKLDDHISKHKQKQRKAIAQRLFETLDKLGAEPRNELNDNDLSSW